MAELCTLGYDREKQPWLFACTLNDPANDSPAELAPSPEVTTRSRLRPARLALGVAAVISLLLQHGFPVGLRFGRWFDWFDVLLALGFSASLVIEAAQAKNRRSALQGRRLEFAILATFLVAVAVVWALPEPSLAPVFSAFRQPSETSFAFAIVRVFLLANVSVQLLRLLQRIFVAGVRAELVLAGSFGALILIGTLLLLMPRVSAHPDARITLMDAFFTATSAVCVTGLVVRDTGSDFSTLGQMIILALFQIGGLGIVTFVGFVSVFSKKTLPVPQMVAFRQLINAPEMDDLKRRIFGIFVLTAFIEGAGAASLYTLVPTEGEVFDRMKWSVFHAVSAFCNAGFALQPESLEFARSQIGVNVVVMLLIVLGGLGFLVMPELIAAAVVRVRRIARFVRPRSLRFLPAHPPRMTLQTRISLRVTVALIVIGFAGFWALEARHILRDESSSSAVLLSAFQSITARTAGFNTLPIGQLQQSTLILLIMLMIVGGSPVSTAGGMKTVTFGILFLALRSMVLRQKNVEAFGRTLPARAFFTALNVFVLYAATAAASIFLLTIFDPQLPLRDILFEAISALSTVGLSTGITNQLSTGSQLVLCVAMFVGRIGPIALVISVFQTRGKVDYDFPTEDVVVG